MVFIKHFNINSCKWDLLKDGPIVEDRVLGIYTNSVYCLRSVHFYMTSLSVVFVLNSNDQR